MDAVIDIGSNSVRLLIPSGAPVTHKPLNSTRLAQGLAQSGALSEDAMTRTIAAVVEFVEKAKEANADRIHIFATEAVRSASNGNEFCMRLTRACGLPVNVVSGDVEASLGLLGVMDDRGGEVTVIDIGGASVEIIKGDNARVSYCKSAPLGMVRLRDLVGDKEEDIEAYIRSALPVYGFVSGHEGVAIGGTATSLASMDLRQTTYDANAIHGHMLTRKALAALRREIFDSSDRIADFPTLSPSRALVIGHGVIMLDLIMEYLYLEYITVSEHDNMEGYLKYILSV